MTVYVRRIVPLLAAGLVASCGTSQDDLGVAKSAHEVFFCDFKTPGYWCGGPIEPGLPGARVTEESGSCQFLGFDNCAELCECFQSASAAKGVDNLSCPADCDDGMADMLQRAWGAFVLSSDAQFGQNVNFVCAGAESCNDFGEYICEPDEVLDILAACDREEQELVKDCIDDILNEGGSCTLPFTPVVDNL